MNQPHHISEDLQTINAALVKKMDRFIAGWEAMNKDFVDYEKYRVKAAYDKARTKFKNLDKIVQEIKSKQIDLL